MKNILFDLGGVLIDLDVRRSLVAFQRLMGNHATSEQDIPCTPGGEGLVTAEGLMGGHDSELINLYQTGDITTDQFVGTILQVCQSGTSRQQVMDAWYAMLLGIREDRKQLLRDLAAAKYDIYILSNINELHVDWTLEHCPELQQAKHLFFSNEMHLSKPDPRCYEQVIREAGIRPEETIYIDDLSANIKAGKSYGFDCVHATDDSWLLTLRQRLGL